MSILRPRDYQVEAIDAVIEAVERGITRPVVLLPVGSGKTVTFAHLINTMNVPTVVLVHRDELAEQAADKIRGIAPDLDVGIVKAERNELDAQVKICSIQTLYQQNRIEQLIESGPIGLIVYDECFPAGTTVDGTNIEQLRPNDLITSWNETTGSFEEKPVVNVMKKRPSSMVRVHFEDGSSLACTPNHPILTSRGWNCAGMLTHGEPVVHLVHDEKGEASSSLCELRDDSNCDRSETHGYLETFEEGVLFRRVSEDYSKSGVIRENVPDESKARFRTHETEQPYASTRYPGEDVSDTAGHRPPSTGSGWERNYDSRTPAQAGRSSGLGAGVLSGNRRRRISKGVSFGYRGPRAENLRRGGRGVPLLTGAPRVRSTPGSKVVLRRVDRVEVLESGSDGTYGGVCPDGFVYNLEVADNHTYTVGSGTVVHNCHHAPAPANRSVLEQLGAYDDVPCVGFTATLKRSDETGLGDVWQEVVFQRSFLWGVANGFLVDVRAKVVTIDDLDLSQIAKSRGDYRDGQLGDAMIRAGAPAIAAREFKEAAGGRQGIGFTPTVRCAEEFVKEFRKIGITTELIVGTTPKAERERIYQEYRDYKVQMLMSVMALTEGFDMPQAEICGLFRPTENTSLYQQMVGRVSRPFPGKDEALILDLVGATKRNHLASLSDLSETQVTLKPEESLREAYERELKEEKNLESDVLTGNTTSKVISLFKSSPNVWIQTPGGRWFIPTREGYVFLWPKDGKFQVGITGSRYKMKGGRFLQELPLSLDLAMAWGEQLASEIDETVSEKDRAWRKRKAEKFQRDLADSLGIVYSEGVRKGELSDMISLHFATEIFD